jgi:hypothetical protein
MRLRSRREAFAIFYGAFNLAHQAALPAFLRPERALVRDRVEYRRPGEPWPPDASALSSRAGSSKYLITA